MATIFSREKHSAPSNTMSTYYDRPSKAAFILQKYPQVLNGASILDVGGGKGYLGSMLGTGSNYINIDLHPEADIKVDLEKPLPFADNSFQVVICLDVLEHLDQLHACFDECCRMSRRWLIISLPNPWCAFFNALRDGEQARQKSMKQIGLPAVPPPDRHRWFFNDLEAKDFLRKRGQLNGFAIRSLEQIHAPFPKGVKGWLWRGILRKILSKELSLERLYVTTLWCLMEKIESRK